MITAARWNEGPLLLMKNVLSNNSDGGQPPECRFGSPLRAYRQTRRFPLRLRPF